METLEAYIPVDRRLAISQGAPLPDRTDGAALFADVSGFTPLTEALMRAYGPNRGAEELSKHLNLVYDKLVTLVHHFGGSVLAFSGDAMTCWFDGAASDFVVDCGLALQFAMKAFAAIEIPDGETVSLAMKVAIAKGPVRRFQIGDPAIQYIDVLAGATLDRMANAEQEAEKGEIVLSQEVTTTLNPDTYPLKTWRVTRQSGEKFAVLDSLSIGHLTEPDLSKAAFAHQNLSDNQLRPWLLPPVYQRLQAGKGDFLAELRHGVVLFLRFGGIDYDSDQDAGQRLDAYIQQVQQVLNRYESYLLQLTIGDKGCYIYSVFGAPIAHEDDAVRAVSAALELQTLSKTSAFIDDVQIGISQGRVRSGAYGGSKRRTYGALGDDVNLAARLMQAAAPGQVLVTEAVQKSTGDMFIWENLPPLKVKGKDDLVSVFCTLGYDPDKRGYRLQTPHYALPMVGREEQLTLIDEKLSLTSSGIGQVIGVLGEAGVGKSRLIAEGIHLASEGGLTSFGGECESYGQNTSYLVWQPIWRAFFKIDSSQSLGEQVDLLQYQLNQVDPLLVQRLPLLSAVLNITLADNEFTESFDAKLRKASLESLLVDCLKHQAASNPYSVGLRRLPMVGSPIV